MQSFEIGKWRGYAPFCEFFPSKVKTQNMHLFKREMNNYMCYKSKYTHQYHIMDVCMCSNEIIIKAFIYFYDLSL